MNITDLVTIATEAGPYLFGAAGMVGAAIAFRRGGRKALAAAEEAAKAAREAATVEARQIRADAMAKVDDIRRQVSEENQLLISALRERIDALEKQLNAVLSEKDRLGSLWQEANKLAISLQEQTVEYGNRIRTLHEENQKLRAHITHCGLCDNETDDIRSLRVELGMAAVKPAAHPVKPKH